MIGFHWLVVRIRVLFRDGHGPGLLPYIGATPTNAPFVDINQSPVHTSGPNHWAGDCTLGEGCSSLSPLGKGIEALRKLRRAFCGRGCPIWQMSLFQIRSYRLGAGAAGNMLRMAAMRHPLLVFFIISVAHMLRFVPPAKPESS